MYPYPGAPGASSGTPPGFAAPGAAFGAGPPGLPGSYPPGMVPPAAAGGGRPMPAGYAPPTNLPANINFNAPVIRLGATGPPRGGAADGPGGRRESGAPDRRGLGMPRDGDNNNRSRENHVHLDQPTREEIARTIFVSNIPDSITDEDIRKILQCAGNLNRWQRMTDMNSKPLSLGLAEFGDAESLETAAEIFKLVEVPAKRPEPAVEGEEEQEVEKTILNVTVDQASVEYAETWKAKRNEDEEAARFRMDGAKEALGSVLRSLMRPRAKIDENGDIAMIGNGQQNGNGVEVEHITFQTTADDELVEIPPEHREMVAREIQAFRDRSIQRDRERLEQEEQYEADIRRRNGRRSPPHAAPTGPAGSSVNGVPLGPKADRGVQGAPTGPRGSQFPKDYQGGMNFVNGGTMNNAGQLVWDDDDDTDASDEELERRRVAKVKEEQHVVFLSKLRKLESEQKRWRLGYDRHETRQQQHSEESKHKYQAQLEYLANFDWEREKRDRKHPFFRDMQDFVRKREMALARETQEDDEDRELERREAAAVQLVQDKAQAMADSFLNEQAAEMEAKKGTPALPSGGFNFSLNSARKKLEEKHAVRRAVADVENLLEIDDIDEAPVPAQILKPLDDINIRNNLTQEEIQQEKKVLASQIPSDRNGLFQWPIAWEFLPAEVIDKDIKNWVEKKIREVVGFDEDVLVETILDHLKAKGKPEPLVDELFEPIDDEAEKLVRKLWRMVIYYSEVEKRNIK